MATIGHDLANPRIAPGGRLRLSQERRGAWKIYFNVELQRRAISFPARVSVTFSWRMSGKMMC